ncbi:MAG: IS1595 family transposase [Nitrospiraceae bacterium]
MARKNRYIHQAHIATTQFRELVRLVALDLEATKVAILTGLNRNTVNRHFPALRQRIARACERVAPWRGTVEVDASYVGPRRVKGTRGRGAGNKTIVFGLVKRNGKVYTEIVPDASNPTRQVIWRGRGESRSIIHSDGWRGYDGGADVGYRKHHRVLPGANEFAWGHGIHINGIESFWGTANTRLAKRRGIRPERCSLHLKECEFRFNHRHDNLYHLLLDMLKQDPLNEA